MSAEKEMCSLLADAVKGFAEIRNGVVNKDYGICSLSNVEYRPEGRKRSATSIPNQLSSPLYQSAERG
jgi:hypothetical protein